MNYLKDKTVLVTGGTGSIGSTIVKQVLEYSPKSVRVFSRDESKHFDLVHTLKDVEKVRCLIGDVRDYRRLDLAMNGVDVVFHAAAMKHVPLCETNPFEAVKTNILGTQNVIECALSNSVEQVVAISTDKAVNPYSVLGSTKLMMEKLFLTADYYKGKSKTKFSVARFGNVLNSTGSVLSLWKKQIKADNVISITEPQMTRFFMTTEQAVELVLKAGSYARSGEIFIVKMPAIKLSDLADLVIKKYGNDDTRTEIIGSRPGEKMDEDLFTAEEGNNLYENEELFMILPNLINYVGANKPLINKFSEYVNDFQMKKSTVTSFCSKDNLVDKNHFADII